MKFDFEIFFLNSVVKIGVSLQSEKNNGYFTKTKYTFMITRAIFLRMRYLRQKLQRKSKHKFYVQKFFSDYSDGYEMTWKNIVKPDRPQMTLKYGVCAMHAR
jgi:hypothetical protein